MINRVRHIPDVKLTTTGSSTIRRRRIEVLWSRISLYYRFSHKISIYRGRSLNAFRSRLSRDVTITKHHDRRIDAHCEGEFSD